MSMRIKQAVNEIKKQTYSSTWIGTWRTGSAHTGKKKVKIQAIQSFELTRYTIKSGLQHLASFRKADALFESKLSAASCFTWNLVHKMGNYKVLEKVLPTLNTSKLLRAYKIWSHGIFTPDANTIEVS